MHKLAYLGLDAGSFKLPCACRGNTQVHRQFGSAVAHHAVPSDSPRASAAGGENDKQQTDEAHQQLQHPRTMELVRVSGGGAARLQRLSQTSGWSTDVSPGRPSNGLTNGYHGAAALVEPVDRFKRLSNPETTRLIKAGQGDAEWPMAAPNGLPDSRSFASEMGAEDWDLLVRPMAAQPMLMQLCSCRS